jgi:hypothetical protein
MQFIFVLLDKVTKGKEANIAAKEAYYETLSRYHGFMVKTIFEIGLLAAPSTEMMLSCLGSDKVVYRTLSFPGHRMISKLCPWTCFSESIGAVVDTENLEQNDLCLRLNGLNHHNN